MKTIWKFPVPVDDERIVKMPQGSKILTVQMQHGDVCLWALVDDAQSSVKRIIQMRGTGHGAEKVGEYIGTVQMMGSLVLHVFDGGEK